VGDLGAGPSSDIDAHSLMVQCLHSDSGLQTMRISQRGTVLSVRLPAVWQASQRSLSRLVVGSRILLIVQSPAWAIPCG
jgi:hypothetical protein